MERAIKHKMMGQDFYRVETRNGERQWLAIPAGTPVQVVTTPVRLPRRAAAVAA